VKKQKQHGRKNSENYKAHPELAHNSKMHLQENYLKTGMLNCQRMKSAAVKQAVFQVKK
jgi:hypothetical protein